MSADALRLIDQVLGVVELVLVPFSVVWLAAAVVQRGRRATGPLVLAAVLALTIAQPFGLKAVPLSSSGLVSGGVVREDAAAVHSVKLLGVPVFGFKPYTRDLWNPNGGDGGEPPTALKVRTWVWPGILWSSTKVEELCGNKVQPCWDPDDDPAGTRSRLQLLRSGDGDWRYLILRADGRRPEPVAAGEPLDRFNGGRYELRPGIVSTAGLAYWGLVAMLATALLLRRRQSLSAG